MFPFLQLGPIAIPAQPLLYLLGLWLALSLFDRIAPRRGLLPAERTSNFGLIIVAAGFIGARLTFVFLHWSAFAQNLREIIWPLNVGYSLWGGLFFAGAALFFLGRYHRLPWLSLLDSLTPSLLAALAAWFLGDLAAGPGFGVPFVDGSGRHWVQLYETAVVLTAAVTWYTLQRTPRPAGHLFAAVLATLMFGLILTTPFRGNAAVWQSWYPAQWLYLVTMLLAFTHPLTNQLTN